MKLGRTFLPLLFATTALTSLFNCAGQQLRDDKPAHGGSWYSENPIRIDPTAELRKLHKTAQIAQNEPK